MNHEKRFKIINKSGLFYKFFIISLLSMSIPVLIISFISNKYSTEHILDQLSRSHLSIFEEKQNNLEQIFSEYDNIINQLVANKNIWDLISSDDISGAKTLQMKSICDTFSKTVEANKNIDSIYLFTKNHDFVLSEIKSSKDSFIDSEILDTNLEDKDRLILPPRVIRNNSVISYIKKFNPILTDDTVYLVINIKTNFFKDMFSSYLSDNSHILIFDDNYNIIYSSNDPFYTINRQTMENISTIDNNFSIEKIDDVDCFICKRHSTRLNWNIAYVNNYSEFIQPAGFFTKTLSTSLFVVLILSIIIAFFFSIYIYKPLENLTHRMKELLNINTLKEKNEYKIIDYVVGNLLLENNDLNQKYNFIFPYFRQNSINELISSHSFDSSIFNEILNISGIEFKFNDLYIVLIDFENTLYTAQLKNNVDSLLSNYKEKFNFLMSKVDNSRAVLIVNTSSSINEVFDIFKSLKTELNCNSVEITVSISDVFYDINNMNEYYQAATQQLNNKFFVGKNEIILNNNFKSINKNIFFDESIEENLLNSISSQNSEEAIEHLRRLTQDLVKNCGYIDYIKYIFFQISTDIICLLGNYGVSLTDDKFTTKDLFEQIQRSNTIHEIEELMISLINKSILLLNDLKNTHHKGIINKVIELINENYSKDLSLDDIASTVLLSTGYLCKIFKAETGLTIYDFITRQRMEAAKQMLLSNSNPKIQDIAAKVGYNNTQSFIRFFKKYFGMTPVDYRRKAFESHNG